MKKKFFLCAILVAVAALVWTSWRRAQNRRCSLSFYAMDTAMTLTAYGPRAEEGLKAAQKRIKELESELSVTDPHSDVGRLNASGGAPTEIGCDAAHLLSFSLKLCADTGGALDLTLYPLLRRWGFTTGTYRVLPRDEIEELLKLTGPEKIRLSGATAQLASGAMIDFGAIAKGLAGSEAAATLRRCGVTAAVANLGGNVQTLGLLPGGGSWRIGIRAPEGGLLGVLQVEEAAVVTSGGYERFFVGPDGKKYWHILDPTTGEPARSGVVSATVTGPSGELCDGLSTAFFVMGAEKAAQYWKDHPGTDFILLTDSGEIWLTEGVEKRFVLDSAYADAPVRKVLR
ncbi:MAG: FAD:protein FMN transferase [Pyramidobacter sp.]|jgi:thiamine biosynthesis lipoprotein